MYYALINILDNSISKAGCPCSGENIICKEITQEVYDNIEKYIYQDGEIILNPDYDKEQLELAKQEKYQEISDKANSFAINGLVEYKEHYFELSNENRKNLQDTQEALALLGQTSTQWSDYYNNIIELTVEDIQYIRLNLMLARIQKLWIEEVPAYQEQVNNATTIEEVKAIKIDYTK